MTHLLKNINQRDKYISVSEKLVYQLQTAINKQNKQLDGLANELNQVKQSHLLRYNLLLNNYNYLRKNYSSEFLIQKCVECDLFFEIEKISCNNCGSTYLDLQEMSINDVIHEMNTKTDINKFHCALRYLIILIEKNKISKPEYSDELENLVFNFTKLKKPGL